MKSNHQFQTAFLTRYLAILVCELAIGQTTLGQPHNNADCSYPLTHQEFILKSETLSSTETARDEILRNLVCIATSPASTAKTATSAVRALYGCGNDADVRRCLLEIITAPTTSFDAHATACALLVYVADDEARAKMLELVKGNLSARTWSNYFVFFEELGDVRFLEWLQQLHSDNGFHALPPWYLEQQIRCGLIQGSAAALLSALADCTENLDPGWLIRQAFRAGASREAVRASALVALETRAITTEAPYRQWMILQACDEFDVLLPQDEKIVALFRVAVGAKRERDVTGTPPRATARIREKRAEFYRLKSNENGQLREPGNDDEGDRK